MLDEKQIIELLKYGERINLECKKAEGKLPNSIWETYSSFANTSGGIILVGVEEHMKEIDPSKRFTFVNVENAERRIIEFWNTINSDKVNINILVDENIGICQIDGKKILWIEVPQADYKQRPVYINGNPIKGSYKRNNEGDYHCTEEEVKAMLRDANDSGNDGGTLNGYTMDDIDINSLRSYRIEFEHRNPEHIWNSLDDVQFLKNMGGYIIDRSTGKGWLTVTGIVFKKCTSVKDADGRFNPQYDENETMTIECSNVIMSVGQAIEWGSLLEGTKVEFWHGNYPVADKVTYQTAEPDIFVGGDVYTGPKFAIDAIAAGKQGAISIHRYVQPHSSLTIGRDPNYYVELDKDDYSVEKYDNTGRQRPAKKSGVDKLSFRSDAGVFTEEQVKKETARCLGCGATIVDENQCVGCGICTTKCEFDAIHLQRDLPECSTMRRSEDKLKYILPYGAKQAIKIKFKKKKD